MEALTPWHLALILLGFVLLFGYKKLPDASRALGRSLRIFKSEMAAAGTETDVASSPAPDELDQQARQAEVEAAELRARAAAVERGAQHQA